MDSKSFFYFGPFGVFNDKSTAWPVTEWEKTLVINCIFCNDFFLKYWNSFDFLCIYLKKKFDKKNTNSLWLVQTSKDAFPWKQDDRSLIPPFQLCTHYLLWDQLYLRQEKTWGIPDISFITALTLHIRFHGNECFGSHLEF